MWEVDNVMELILKLIVYILFSIGALVVIHSICFGIVYLIVLLEFYIKDKRKNRRKRGR